MNLVDIVVMQHGVRLLILVYRFSVYGSCLHETNFLCFEIALLHILCDREEKCYKLQKSIPRNDWCIDFRLPLGYNGIEKCNKLQKSFARRLDDGDSQRFLFE